MPSPSQSLATVRPDLADSFLEFDVMMDMAGFIGLRAAPVMEVDTVSGNFGRIPIEQMLQQPDTVRAPGSAYNSGKWTFLPDTYACVEHGWEEPVDDRESRMYRRYFNAETVAARRAMRFVMASMEARVRDIYEAATQTAAVDTTWRDTANSTPLDDIEAACQAIYDASGVWPNAVLMTKKTFRNCRRSEQITGLIKYSGQHDPTASGISGAVLGEVFDLPKILISGGTQNTANPGQAATPGSLWSNDKVIVAHITDSPDDPKSPTFSRTFHWGEDGSSIGGTVESYRWEETRGDRIRVRNDTHEKLMYNELAYVLTGAAAAP